MKGNDEVVEGTRHTELLQGTLPFKELKKLEMMLHDSEFHTLPKSGGGILLRGAETFVAEVPRASGAQRVVVHRHGRGEPVPAFCAKNR